MSAEAALSNIAGISSIASFWMFMLSRAFQAKARQIGIAAAALLALCFACVTLSIVARGLAAARFPIANLYESLLLFSWGLLLLFLLWGRSKRLPQMGWLTALTVSCVFLYLSWLPASQHEIKPLMPALVSYWRAIHVPPLIVSYAFLVMGGLLAIGHLWLARRIKTAVYSVAALSVCLASIALGTFTKLEPQIVQLIFWLGLLVTCTGMVRVFVTESREAYPATPQVDAIDELSQKCISTAFPLLTFGIVTGALWANHAWGSYWSWDPKESMSLATWLSYAAYLHLRSRTGSNSDCLSLCAVLGLLLTLLTYLGFTFLGIGGLHSYGRIS